MKDYVTRLTPKEAATIVGCSTRLIQKYITSGKLCASKEDGKYFIDRSEFFRVFPKAHKKEQDSNVAYINSERERLHNENEALKQSSKRKDEEIDFLRTQMQSVTVEKTKMLDAIVSYTKLLEHKSIAENKKWSIVDWFKKKD